MITDGAQAHDAVKQADLATRDTPLIRNEWYVAALAEEVTRKPMRRTILEQDIVLYRDQNGKPVALQNRCAHRSYPLHLGELNGDRIVCGYHGFEFGPDGRCAHLPALGDARPGIRIQPYPTVEIGPFIWIWTGDPAAVDHGKLMKQPWFTEPGWRYVSGYFDMQANYLGLRENLLDLSHFAFLHSFGRGHVHLARQRSKIETRPDGIHSSLEMPNFPVSPVVQKEMQFQGPVTERSSSRTTTPAMHCGNVTQTDSSDPPRILNRHIVHCTTPQTQTKTHYFWAISRDGGLKSQAMDDEIMQVATCAFDEDRVALEEIEKLLERDNRPDFREAITVSDFGGVQVLRMFARMAAAEAEAQRVAAE